MNNASEITSDNNKLSSSSPSHDLTSLFVDDPPKEGNVDEKKSERSEDDTDSMANMQTHTQNIILEEIDNTYRQFLDEYQEVLAESIFEDFKLQIFELFSSLKLAKINENNLKERCKTLENEIEYANIRYQATFKNVQKDQEVVKILKKDLANYMNLLEESKEKESRAKATITELENQSRNLHQSIEKFSSQNVSNENRLHDSIMEKEALLKEKSSLLATLQDLENLKQEFQTQINAYEEQKKTDNSETENLRILNDSTKIKLDNEIKKREQLQEHIYKLKDDLVSKEKELKNEIEAFNRERVQLNRKSQEIASKRNSDYIVRIKTQLQDEIKKMETKCNELEVKNQELKKRNKECMKDSEFKTKQLIFLKWEKLLNEHSVERMKSQILKSNEKRIELEGKLRGLKQEIQYFTSDIEQHNRKAIADRQAIDKLHIQSRSLNKTLINLASNTQSQQELIQQKEHEKTILSRDLDKQAKEHEKLQSKMKELTTTKNQLLESIDKVNEKHEQAIEQLSMREKKVREIQQDLKEYKMRLLKQKDMHRLAQNELNMCSLTLTKKKSEIIDLKEKIKDVNQKIDTHKKTLQEKNSTLNHLTFALHKSRQENEHLKGDVENTNKNIEILQTKILEQKSHIENLDNETKIYEAKEKRDHVKYLKAFKDRKQADLMLSKKNKEAEELITKVKVQEYTLDRTIAELNEKSKTLINFQKSNKILRRQAEMAEMNIKEAFQTSSLVNAIQKQLIQEKMKFMFLSEEFKKATLVHPIQLIKKNNFDVYQLISKTRFLQKQLLVKNKQIQIKELEIKEKQNVIENLKKVTSRYSEPELLTELTHTRQELMNKNNKVKSLAAEVREYRFQIIRYKEDIETISKDLQSIKSTRKHGINLNGSVNNGSIILASND